MQITNLKFYPPSSQCDWLQALLNCASVAIVIRIEGINFSCNRTRLHACSVVLNAIKLRIALIHKLCIIIIIKHDSLIALIKRCIVPIKTLYWHNKTKIALIEYQIGTIESSIVLKW